jgi:hypothetical protein
MGSLLCFLLLACLLSILALVSRSSSIWSRMLIAPLLAVVYGLNSVGLGGFVTQGLLAAGIFWIAAFLRWDRCSVDQFRRSWGPLAVAIVLVSFVAFRPSLLEYPVDHINYWQRLIEASGDGSANALACDLGGPSAYIPYCTLWFKLAAAWPVSGAWVVSGLFARLVHFGELLLLSLVLIRFWLSQSIRPISAACMLVLVFAGTGYLYDAFVVNHALQGSILAAAMIVECASVLCWIFARLRACRCQSAGELLSVLGWYLVSAAYLLLAVKLHGLFALLVLIWILIVPIVLALLGLGIGSPYGLSRLVRLLFGVTSLMLTMAMFVGKGAQNVPIPANFAGVVIRWSDRLGLGGLGDFGPVSFVPRTSDTRPEALAVLGLIVSFVIILSTFKVSRIASVADVGTSFSAGFGGVAEGRATDYALLTSVYVLSILCAYVLPPFSNLFLKLNPEYSSHMRLMWGACLVSPLACLLFWQAGQPRRLASLFSLAAMVVVLLPIQFAAGQRKQLFFSKSRHFMVPTPAWADPSQLAAAVLPELHRLAAHEAGRRRLVVVGDPLVRSALYPFGIAAIPPLGIGADRLLQLDQLPPDVQAATASAPRIHSSLLLDQRPDVVIQQPVRDCFYSVYADMQAYAPCIAARASGFEVNRWSPALLRGYGYVLDRELASSGLRIWRRRSA